MFKQSLSYIVSVSLYSRPEIFWNRNSCGQQTMKWITKEATMPQSERMKPSKLWIFFQWNETYLSKFKHGKFTRISKIKRTHMFSLHEAHQTLHLFWHTLQQIIFKKKLKSSNHTESITIWRGQFHKHGKDTPEILLRLLLLLLLKLNCYYYDILERK